MSGRDEVLGPWSVRTITLSESSVRVLGPRRLRSPRLSERAQEVLSGRDEVLGPRSVRCDPRCEDVCDARFENIAIWHLAPPLSPWLGAWPLAGRPQSVCDCSVYPIPVHTLVAARAKPLPPPSSPPLQISPRGDDVLAVCAFHFARTWIRPSSNKKSLCEFVFVFFWGGGQVGHESAIARRSE